MTGFILWVLGLIMTYRLAGRDVINSDGTIKDALDGWVRVVAAIFWPFFSFMVVFDAVKAWIARKRNKA